MIKEINKGDLAIILGVHSIREDIEIVEALATPISDANILYSVAKTVEPKSILEIGTFYGHTTYGFSKNCPNSKIYTIDICKEMNIKIPKYQEIETLPRNEVGGIFKNNTNLNITQIFGDSKDMSTFNLLPVMDFVYIDGCHDKEAVITDTKNALKITRQGSIVFWHDYKDDGFVQTKEALREISCWQEKCIYHINDSWLAVMVI